ncbi:MAG: hypothetical protein J7L95_02760 [Prolixibacteraceae bacterium]|nr:hypothetical protein [Prolixibacteraceae bacterium]
MHKKYLLLSLIFVLSCSTGKKALQKGDYFSAVTKAVERLRSNPDNENAARVLKESYPMAIDWSQEEMDLALTSNASFKWGKAVDLMEQINHLSNIIRKTPAAREIIKSPKNYSTELNMAREKAADARYRSGEKELEQNTRDAARIAYDDFSKADRLMPGYKNVYEKLSLSKKLATVYVIIEAIPVNTLNFKLSSEFFYNQVFNFLNQRFPEESFVNFFSPKQAKNAKIKYPDFIVRMEFFDFEVGNTVHNEKEELIENRVKIETKDTTKTEYKTYKAKLKTFTDVVDSKGRLRVRIVEPNNNKLFMDEILPGAFEWINDYAIFIGDKEALNKKQLELTKHKALPLPEKQDLFIEFTKPLYDQLTVKLKRFFRDYDS